MTKIVYFSQTGQTRKFVEKVTSYEKIEITPDFPDVKMDKDFILVMPSYEEDVHPIVLDTAEDFLETSNNRQHCKGLFGTGNRNFAQLFCVTARTLAKKYKIPLLHQLEFQGSPIDVNKLKEELEKIESSH